MIDKMFSQSPSTFTGGSFCCRPRNIFIPDKSQSPDKNGDAPIPSSIPVTRWGLGRPPHPIPHPPEPLCTRAVLIVSALNRQRAAWAAVGLNLCLSAHSADVCYLLLVDSPRSLLTTDCLCAADTSKSSQLRAIRLQNADWRTRTPRRSIRWWQCWGLKSATSFAIRLFLTTLKKPR